MTVVEVLVASGVSAVVATGLATLSLTGTRTLEVGVRQWGEVAAVSGVLTQWPHESALGAPAPGWSPGTLTTVTAANGVSLTTVTWTRPDGSPLALTITQPVP